MPSSIVRAFNDPDDYFAAVRSAEVDGVVTARGDYRAELTCIGLNRVVMQRGYDSLARVVNVAASLQLIGIHFATDPNQTASYFSGIELPQNAVMVLGLGCQQPCHGQA